MRRIYIIPLETYIWAIFFAAIIVSHSKMYCSKLASPLLCIPEYFFWVRVYIDFFHDIIFYYSLTSTRTLTFGYIKLTPDVSFTGIFLDIVLGQNFRQEMGKNCHQKCGMSLSSHFFSQKYCPWCHFSFVRNERLECESKVPIG